MEEEQAAVAMDRSEHRPFWARLLSRQVQFALDLMVLVSAFAISYLLRFDFNIPKTSLHHGLIQLPVVVLIQFAAIFLCGIYAFIWRYIGMAEISAFLKAAWWSFLPVLLMRLGLPDKQQEWRVPLSIILMDTVFAFGGTLALRVLRRGLYERYEKHQRTQNGNGKKLPVLLIGAGQAGVLAAKEIQNRGDMGLEVKGFVDDDPEKIGAVIQSVKVLGGTDDLPAIVKDREIDHVIITIAQASRRDIERIVKICETVPVRVRIIPGLYEILEGKVEVSRIRDVEIEDLLGRDPVRLDDPSVKDFITGKVVMVTGAGGSIGSELARQAASLAPSRLLLVERAEFVLFDIHRSLVETFPEVSVVPLVADVGDERRMRAIFAEHTPRVILHAAAHKHVPMMEMNPAEAVKNNVLATRLLGQIAGESGAEAFVLISTDKAVRPTSVMGASKRTAELITQDLQRSYATRYVAVRFGNVLGSTGSVIPIFREQIRKGGPVTVTDPEMVRYFMTIPEAAQLVLQASAMGQGGEIFILDMGEPVKILDLAREMISLSGLTPYEDIDIVFTGARPGEKLVEELGTRAEHVVKTRHPKIYIGNLSPYTPERVQSLLDNLRELAQAGDPEPVRRCLREFLPESRLA